MTNILRICILINLVFVAAEAFLGFWSNSTGLLSDAGHNLSDVLGLILSLVAILLESKKSNFSKSVSKYLTLTNGLLLMAAVVIIAIESVEKIISPEVVNGGVVIVTSLFAIIINGLTTYLLMKGRSGNINIKAAYLHAATDMLVSVGVVISGIIISLTGANIIDPIISLIITVIIGVPTIRLVKDAIRSIINV